MDNLQEEESSEAATGVYSQTNRRRSSDLVTDHVAIPVRPVMEPRESVQEVQATPAQDTLDADYLAEQAFLRDLEDAGVSVSPRTLQKKRNSLQQTSNAPNRTSSSYLLRSQQREKPDLDSLVNSILSSSAKSPPPSQSPVLSTKPHPSRSTVPSVPSSFRLPATGIEENDAFLESVWEPEPQTPSQAQSSQDAGSVSILAASKSSFAVQLESTRQQRTGDSTPTRTPLSSPSQTPARTYTRTLSRPPSLSTGTAASLASASSLVLDTDSGASSDSDSESDTIAFPAVSKFAQFTKNFLTAPEPSLFPNSHPRSLSQPSHASADTAVASSSSNRGLGPQSIFSQLRTGVLAASDSAVGQTLREGLKDGVRGAGFLFQGLSSTVQATTSKLGSRLQRPGGNSGGGAAQSQGTAAPGAPSTAFEASVAAEFGGRYAPGSARAGVSSGEQDLVPIPFEALQDPAKSANLATSGGGRDPGVSDDSSAPIGPSGGPFGLGRLRDSLFSSPRGGGSGGNSLPFRMPAFLSTGGRNYLPVSSSDDPTSSTSSSASTAAASRSEGGRSARMAFGATLQNLSNPLRSLLFFRSSSSTSATGGRANATSANTSTHPLLNMFKQIFTSFIQALRCMLIPILYFLKLVFLIMAGLVACCGFKDLSVSLKNLAFAMTERNAIIFLFIAATAYVLYLYASVKHTPHIFSDTSSHTQTPSEQMQPFPVA